MQDIKTRGLTLGRDIVFDFSLVLQKQVEKKMKEK
jgi:hypothetical protein